MNMKKTSRTLLLLVALAPIVFLASCASTSTNADGSPQVSAHHPIGIVSAIEEDVELLLQTAKIKKTETMGGIEYHIGKIGDKDVVIAMAGMGKIHAATSATTMINHFNVSYLIFTGIAGGVNDDTKVMDVVISTEMVVHDYGTITEDGFVWRAVPGAIKGKIPANQRLIDLAYAAAVAEAGKDCVFTGVIASGSQFIASEAFVNKLQNDFNAYACEMEGGAVALVAQMYDVPFVVIRCLSDKADGKSHYTMENFADKAGDRSAKILISMIGEI